MILGAFLGPVVLGAIGLARAVIFLFWIIAEAAFVDHFERGQQFVDGNRKGSLILDLQRKPVKLGTRALLDPRPPEIDNPLRVVRRPEPGETLAHDHRERVFERRLRADRDISIVGAMKPVVEHRVEIARDALHPARPYRLDARLFDGIEHRARGWRLRGQPPMHIHVVAGEPQCHRIGVPAQNSGFPRIELARGFRQPRFGVGAGPNQARPLGRESDLGLRHFCHGAQA